MYIKRNEIKRERKQQGFVRMMMILYYNNFFTIYKVIIKFYKFYVHNRMANAIHRSYFIPAIERYCTISNSDTRFSHCRFYTESYRRGQHEAKHMERHVFLFFIFFFFFQQEYIENERVYVSRGTRRSARQRNH